MRIEIISVGNESSAASSECASDSGPLPTIDAGDPALLMYTSGQHGPAEGGCSYPRVRSRPRQKFIAFASAHRRGSVALVLPLYHINAECVTLIPTLMSGGSVVVPHGFVVSEFWNWLDDYRCTWSALVPTIISQLLDWKDPKAESRAAPSSGSAFCALPRRRCRRRCTGNSLTNSSCR